MHLTLYTWNAAEALERGVPLPTSGWLTSLGSDGGSATAPDLCVVGFQESISLPAALAGATPSFIDAYVNVIKNKLESNARASGNESSSGSDSSYHLVARNSIGALALLVYANGSMKDAVEDVATAEVGCGPLFMSNKGAVGVRFRLKESQAVVTLVTAHLAAHDYNVSRRNLDWKSIVERMVFYQHEGEERYQIYDTDYLYVLGDLNYRTSKTEPKKLDKETLSTLLEKQQYKAVLAHDQLAIESLAGRTLQHLVEEDIVFPPTYKYNKGTEQLVSFTKRVPSYCDRILHLPSEGLQALRYTSIHGANPSDHMPVVASYSIKADKQTRTRWQSPYAIDDSTLWNNLIGTVIDRIVGNAWRIIALIGFGSDKLGLLLVLVTLAITLLSRQFDLSVADTLDKVEHVYKRLR